MEELVHIDGLVPVDVSTRDDETTALVDDRTRTVVALVTKVASIPAPVPPTPSRLIRS